MFYIPFFHQEMNNYFIKPKKYSLDYDFEQPLNFEISWSKLIKKDLQHSEVYLGARLLKNVFVSHYGLVLKKGILVKGCAPNIGFIKYKDQDFYLNHWKKGFEQMLVCKYGKSLDSVHLGDNEKYLVIHSPWFSNYFWISECLPRLLMVKDKLDELTLIYPESWAKIPYVNETLDLFTDLKKIIIPDGVHLFVKNLVMPEVKPWTPIFIPEIIEQTRSFLLKGFNIKKEETMSKIYISRRSAKRRKFLDEDCIEAILSKYGVVPVQLENLSFRKQISLLYNCSFACGITGAGHINLMFMNKGSFFFDFTNVGYKNSEIYKFHYQKLCNIVGVKYLVQFFDYKIEENITKFSQQPLVIDKELLKINLNLVNYE